MYASNPLQRRRKRRRRFEQDAVMMAAAGMQGDEVQACLWCGLFRSEMSDSSEDGDDEGICYACTSTRTLMSQQEILEPQEPNGRPVLPNGHLTHQGELVLRTSGAEEESNERGTHAGEQCLKHKKEENKDDHWVSFLDSTTDTAQVQMTPLAKRQSDIRSPLDISCDIGVDYSPTDIEATMITPLRSTTAAPIGTNAQPIMRVHRPDVAQSPDEDRDEDDGSWALALRQASTEETEQTTVGSPGGRSRGFNTTTTSDDSDMERTLSILEGEDLVDISMNIVLEGFQAQNKREASDPPFPSIIRTRSSKRVGPGYAHTTKKVTTSKSKAYKELDDGYRSDDEEDEEDARRTWRRLIVLLIAALVLMIMSGAFAAVGVAITFVGQQKSDPNSSENSPSITVIDDPFMSTTPSPVVIVQEPTDEMNETVFASNETETTWPATRVPSQSPISPPTAGTITLKPSISPSVTRIPSINSISPTSPLETTIAPTPPTESETQIIRQTFVPSTQLKQTEVPVASPTFPPSSASPTSIPPSVLSLMYAPMSVAPTTPPSRATITAMPSPKVVTDTLEPTMSPTEKTGNRERKREKKRSSNNVEPSDNGFPSFSFFVLGDVPYSDKEGELLKQQMSDLRGEVSSQSSSETADFAVHVGDLLKAKVDFCSPESYDRAVVGLSESPVPVIVLPGDNDWNDCPDPNVGWSLFSSRFQNFEDGWSANSSIPSMVNRAHRRWENFVFLHHDVLFMGFNMVAGLSGAADNFTQRIDDNLEWLSSNVEQYVDQARAVVLFGHSRKGKAMFKAFRTLLSGRENLHVLFIHGNGHHWEVERPYSKRASDPWETFWRIQVDQGYAAPPIKVRIRGTTEEALRETFTSSGPWLRNFGPDIQVDRRGGTYEERVVT